LTKDECTAVKEAKIRRKLKKKHARQMGHNLKDYEKNEQNNKPLGDTTAYFMSLLQRNYGT